MNKITVWLAAFKMILAAIPKPSTSNHTFIPTGASTQPSGLPVFICRTVQHGQFAEHCAGKWYKKHNDTLSYMRRKANKAKCAKVMEH
jgi:hypothetical protein